MGHVLELDDVGAVQANDGDGDGNESCLLPNWFLALLHLNDRIASSSDVAQVKGDVRDIAMDTPPEVSDECASGYEDNSDVSEDGYPSDGPCVVRGDVWLSELSTCLDNTQKRSVRPKVRAPKDVSSDTGILEALSAKVSLLNVLGHIIVYDVVVHTLIMYPLSSFQS